MKLSDQGIRKAAILAASLDRATADALLEQLAPDEARRVRQAMVDLDRIDPREQRRVIEEFFRCGPPLPEKHARAVELEDRLAQNTPMSDEQPGDCPDSRKVKTGLPPAESLRTDKARPFRFLREAEGDKLARVLRGERPQTIALVLSHLPAEQAGGVLGRLQADLQVEVIQRLVELEEADPEILCEVEQALESRLSQQVRMQRRRVAGLKAVTGILEASCDQVAEQILGNLAAHDQPLAEKLRRPAFRFDDLARLDDAALLAVFRAAEPEVAMTALVGAPPELIDRILRQFAVPEAETVRHKLDHPGPLRLSDVETARQQIADLARRLAGQRKIELPNPTQLAAA